MGQECESVVAKRERKVRHPVPNWIREWGREFEKDGVSLEEALGEARQVSRSFKTALSDEIIAEREARR